MCQPASRPSLSGIPRAVCTSGLTPLSLPSTPTPVRPSLLCPASWTHCRLWTGARTCCPSPSSPFRSPPTRCSPTGLLPTLLRLPGGTSHPGQRAGGGGGPRDQSSRQALLVFCFFPDFCLLLVFSFFSGPLGIGDWMGRHRSLQALELYYIIGEHPLWMQRFCAP